MDALGYPLTWQTRCFIGSGCGKTVYAHTNGYGDFVLFNQLGWPWTIHECYFERFDVHIGRSRKVAHRGTLPRAWDSVTPITPDAHGPHRRYGFIGTVTNVEKGFTSKSKEFRDLANRGAEEVKRVLAGRTSLITIVTGQGAEFTAFCDIKKHPVEFRDIVVCDIKAVRLFNKSIFVITQMKEFGSDDS